MDVTYLLNLAGECPVEGQHKEWTGQSISSLLCIADDGNQWLVITADLEAFEGVPQRHFGVTGIRQLVSHDLVVECWIHGSKKAGFNRFVEMWPRQTPLGKCRFEFVLVQL